jgi:hypothetical protein
MKNDDHQIKHDAFVKACSALGLYNGPLAQYFRRLYDVFEKQKKLIESSPECKVDIWHTSDNHYIVRNLVKHRSFMLWSTLMWSTIPGEDAKEVYPSHAGTKATTITKEDLRRTFNAHFCGNDDILDGLFLNLFNRRLQVDAVMLKVSSRNLNCGMDSPDLAYNHKIKNFDHLYIGHIQAISFYSILCEGRQSKRKRKKSGRN